MAMGVGVEKKETDLFLSHTNKVSESERACHPPKRTHERANQLSPMRVMSWHSLNTVALSVLRMLLFSKTLSCGWPSRAMLKMSDVGSFSPGVPR